MFVCFLFGFSWLFLSKYEIKYFISDRRDSSLENQNLVLTVQCKTFQTIKNDDKILETSTKLQTTTLKPTTMLDAGKVPKVLCWIMTTPKNHNTKAKAVKLTWAKRCDKVLFMSSKEDLEIGSITLNVSEGRENLWAKTKEAFRYVHKHFLKDFDWFLKADDDTFVIVENLKYFLQSKSPEEPIYFGSRLKPMVRQGFMSGGAGYVLSKKALQRFVEDALTNEDICYKGNNGPEDVEIGKCLQNVNVTAGDTRDENGRGRFFPMAPENHLVPEPITSWYWSHIYYPTKDGLDCCSDRPISFHYIDYKKMYAMEYLIYQVKVSGDN